MSWPSVILLSAAQESDSVAARIRSFGVHWDSITESDVLRWRGYSYSLDFSGQVWSDFEPDEMADITARIGPPSAIYISCESMAAARTLLLEALEGFSGGLIDTNHGDVVDFDRFTRLVKDNPQWDWRRTEVSELLDQTDS